jgi:hypothetical protein
VNVSFGEIIARVAVRTYCQEFWHRSTIQELASTLE